MTTTPSARRLSALVAPALLALSLTACGGGADGAPDDASKDDFCKVWNDDGDAGAFDGKGSADEQAAKIKDQLEKATGQLKDVGTPQDIPSEAREGFELFVDAVDGVDEDDIKKSIEDENPDVLDQGLDEGDQKKVTSFTDWASGYCG